MSNAADLQICIHSIRKVIRIAQQQCLSKGKHVLREKIPQQIRNIAMDPGRLRPERHMLRSIYRHLTGLIGLQKYTVATVDLGIPTTIRQSTAQTEAAIDPITGRKRSVFRKIGKYFILFAIELYPTHHRTTIVRFVGIVGGIDAHVQCHLIGLTNGG